MTKDHPHGTLMSDFNLQKKGETTPVQADGGGTQHGDETGGGHDAAGESGGGAYPNPHTDKDGSDRGRDQGGQSEVAEKLPNK